jgi:hypothetical protein
VTAPNAQAKKRGEESARPSTKDTSATQSFARRHSLLRPKKSKRFVAGDLLAHAPFLRLALIICPAAAANDSEFGAELTPLNLWAGLSSNSKSTSSGTLGALYISALAFFVLSCLQFFFGSSETWKHETSRGLLASQKLIIREPRFARHKCGTAVVWARRIDEIRYRRYLPAQFQRAANADDDAAGMLVRTANLTKAA